MKPLKILFADDDLKYSMLLKRFLEKEGYEVTYAGNGSIAIEQFPLVKPDLVLLDINMPGHNGFEVAERIRETDKHVLIFFLSDRSDKADRLQGFQLRANDYLAKPFYPEVLITSRQAEILRLLAKNLNLSVDRDLLLNTVWSSASYANSLALNVQITYLRKALRNDSSVKIESLMKKGYVLKDK